MISEIEDFFHSEKIEYFAALPYSDVYEISHEIMARESFIPRSVIVFLIPYYAGETVNISRYAASFDYHIIIKDITSRLITLLHEKFPGSSAKGYGDHSPIDERGAALTAGLGILGKNGLIINEKYGSYVFIGDVVTDVPEEELGCNEKNEIKRCCGCGACLAACPTGVLRGESYDCLSAITQRKGELSEKEKDLMKKFNTVWGCDLCQSSCPHNSAPRLTPIPFFYQNRIEKLDSNLLSTLTGKEFRKRAFAWRGRRTLERNLEIFEEKE